ncbi:MAG: STAS domain-containing protein [Chromatiales bacterium]|nr:STAS domain-containing protein [Chromatiales bacterium]
MAKELRAGKKSQTVKKTAAKVVQLAAKKKMVRKAAAKKPRVITQDDGFIEAGTIQNAVLTTAEERGCRIVRFGSSCTLQEAAALRSALLAELDMRKPMLLDACAVAAVDTAGVQMLVDLAIECMERGLAFRWKGRSAVVEHAIGALGVGALLESPGSVDQFAGLV